jgi:hypothetical protein
MSIDQKLLETFTDPLVWCESYLKDPTDREKPLTFRSYQRDVIQNTREYQNIVLQWGRRCLVGDTNILLSDGKTKKIKDIQTGDQVLSYDSSKDIWSSYDKILQPALVSHTFNNSIQDVYKITLSSGFSIECTSNHPILTQSNNKLQYLSIDDGLAVGTSCIFYYKRVLSDQITEIKYVGKQQTYDITIENFHNFIANNIVVHNSGKTIIMCSDCLWWATAYPLVRMIEEGSSKKKPFNILIFTPYESQIKIIWNTFTQLIGDSPLLKEQIKRIRTSDHHLLEFYGQGSNEGSKIEGFTIGISSSNQGTSLRGLGGDYVYVDEMDYIPQEIMEQVVIPITTTRPDCKRRICSTPTGQRTLYFQYCSRASELGWYHSHVPSWHPDNKDWLSQEKAIEQGIPITKSTEFQVKSITPSETYRREYGAEFGESLGGVYKHAFINNCLKKYGREIDVSDTDIFDPGFTQVPEHKYIIGVDWNSYKNGGQVVLLEYCATPTAITFYDDEKKTDVVVDFTGKFRLFYRRGVKSKDATQRNTRNEVIRLLYKYKIDYIYVDYGAGDTNIEELTHYGLDHPELNLHQKLRVVDSGAVVEHYDYILQKHVKKRNKSLMVSFSTLSLEEGMMVLPQEEDLDTRLVGQMRNYKIKTVTARGEYSYEGEDHILDAFNLAMYGFQQNYGQLLNSKIIYSIHTLPIPMMERYPQRSNLVPVNVNFRKHSNTYSMPIRDPDRPLSLKRPTHFSRSGFGGRTDILTSHNRNF